MNENEVSNNSVKNAKIKFIYLTIFPRYFEAYFDISIQNKAKNNEIIDYEVYNIRDYAENKRVDDYQYGGGKGMVMKIAPIVSAIREIKRKIENPYFILLNPQAKIFKQYDVERLVKKKNIVFICGHYEGIDRRITDYIDEELSIGEFITMGGEVPSLVISEALIRGIPGLIKTESFMNESFSKDKFDYDCYTRPKEFEGLKVPDILLSGNHKEIKKWRKNNSIEKEKMNN